jgi:hypothetical protein
VLAPVWIAGLVRLFRDPTVRDVRFLAWAWVILAVVYMVGGGKPYYLAGLLPVLLGAGAVWVDGWLDRGRRAVRRTVLAAAIATSGVIGVLLSLPVLPARDSKPVIAINPDVGETINWPAFARTVASVYDGLPGGGHPVILAQNYGEAGAIARFGPGLGLPYPYSGHNAFAYWGSPPDSSGPVVAIGLYKSELAEHLLGCRPAARIDNGLGIDNDEQGTEIYVCAGPGGSWSSQWDGLRHLG